MEWLLLFAVMLVFVGMFYWIRERRAAHRDAEQARAESFLMQMASVSAAAPPTNQTPLKASEPAPVSAPEADGSPRTPLRAAEAAVAASAPSGPQYLDHRHRVVYFWLKMGLPNYEILPRGSLRRVVGREQASKDMLLDFVICDAALSVVAVVDLDRGPEGAAAVRFKKVLLQSVGVRYACWPAEALPDKSTLPFWLENA